MSEDNTLIEVVTIDEELPSDVKKRVLRINAMSDDDRIKIADLINKLNIMLADRDDSHVVNSIVDLKAKLTQIMLYIAKLEEKIDAIPVDTNVEDVDYIRNDLESYANTLLTEIRSAREIISKKIEYSKPEGDEKIDYVRDDLQNLSNNVSEDIKGMKNEITTKIDNLDKTLYTTISDDIVVSAEMNKTLNELSTRLFEVETSINNKVDEIKSFVRQSSEAVDNTLTSMYTIRDVMNKSAEMIDLSSESMKNASAGIAEKLDNLSSFSDNVTGLGQKIEGNIKSLEETQTKINEMVVGINRKTDDTLNVVYSKVADLDYINTDLKNSVGILNENTKGIVDAKTKLEDNLNVLDDIKSKQKKTEKSLTTTITKIGKNSKEIVKGNTEIKKSATLLKNVEREYKKKETLNRELLNEMKRFNTNLSKLGEAEFYYRILEMKKRVKKYKRLPAWATERKLRIINEMVIFENDLNDLTVIYTLLKGDASFTELKKVTGIGDKFLKNSLNRLTAENRIKKFKKGRFFFYMTV
jgi:chromosome segregation ATPase